MKRLLMALVALVALVATIGAGTLAYFSDQQSSAGNAFTAGTLDLQISADATTFGASDIGAVWKSPENWKPGDTVDAKIYVKDTGTVDTGALQFQLIEGTTSNPSSTKDFVDRIEVVCLTDSTVTPDGDCWIQPGLDLKTFSAYDSNADKHLTLRELINGAGGPQILEADGALLKYTADAPFFFRFGFKFMDAGNASDNDYQGASTAFTLTVSGQQSTTPVVTGMGAQSLPMSGPQAVTQ